MPAHHSNFRRAAAPQPLFRRRVIAPVVAVLVLALGGTAHAVPSERYDHGAPTEWEQVLLERVNRARADPQAEADRLGIDLNEGLQPGTISPDPKPPLAMHGRLIDAARGHSAWMLAHDAFSHEGDGGSAPHDRIAAAGYDLSPPWTTGENIAVFGTTGALNIPAAVESTHDGLFRSPPHRVNLLSNNFAETGWGLARGDVERQDPNTGAVRTRDVIFGTEKFARSAASPGPFLVGVVYDDLNGNGQYDAGEGAAEVSVRPGAGQYYAHTSESGGYAIPLGNLTGSLAVTISGENWPNAVTRYVDLDGSSVKVDFSTADILYWIGNYTEVPPLIYHAQHAWTYAEWTVHENVYLYDFGIGSWLWTGRSVYPYLYKFGSDSGWLFYFQGTFSPNRYFHHSGHQRVMTEAELASP